MEICPGCNRLGVAFDGYRRVKKCHFIDCGAVIYEDGSYSFIRHDSDKIRKIRQCPINGNTTVIKEYNYPYLPYP